MMKKYVFSFALFLAMFTLPQLALAHERQVFTINGKQYLFIVGSLNEPTFVDDKSGVDLTVKLADPANPGDSSSLKAKPVEGLDKTLKVEVSAGDKKKIFTLVPAWQKLGSYYASFYPSVQTTYAYRIFGTIEGTRVDLGFTCANGDDDAMMQEDKTVTKLSDSVTRVLKIGMFGCPASKTESQFPEQAASQVDLNNKTNDANAQAATASNTAAIALILATVSIIIGIVAWIRRKAH